MAHATLRRLARSAAVLLTGGLAVVGGVGALLGSACLTDSPAVVLLSGLGGVAGVAALGTEALARTGPPGRRAHVRRLGGMVTLAGVAVTAVAVLTPLRDPRTSPEPVPGQGTWTLPSGHQVAYVRVAAVGTARPTPLIFLHGGPGIPDLRGDAALFGQLAADGYDVYVYAQTGSGASDRLDDPRGYTLDQHVDDLEAIREQLGAEQIVLVGHSWGAIIAAAYVARHGEHVARLILSSPGALPGSHDSSDSGLTGRLSLGGRLRLYRLLIHPRVLTAYALLQVNPRAAHAFAGDAEMDARLDRVYNSTRSGLHCHGLPSGPALHGLGFYAYAFPQSAARPAPRDITPELAVRDLPTLILKGECDYLSWSSAIAYRQALPHATLTYLPGAGHNVYQDQPDAFLSAVRTFLDGRMPDGAVTGDAPPSGYEGPP